MAKAKALEDRFLDPTPDWLEAKTKVFGFEPSEAAKDALNICGLKRALKKALGREWVEINFGLPIPGPEVEIFPVLGELDRFTRIVKPESLDQLKALAGVPNSALLEARKIDPCGCQPRPTRTHLLPGGKRLAFSKLDPEQREAVHDAATNLVYGYADPEAVKLEPLAAVADYALRRASELPVFATQSLVVCDGESVHFNGWSSLYFNHVIVEGSGQIHLGHNTKLHAFQIEHI